MKVKSLAGLEVLVVRESGWMGRVYLQGKVSPLPTSMGDPRYLYSDLAGRAFWATRRQLEELGRFIHYVVMPRWFVTSDPLVTCYYREALNGSVDVGDVYRAWFVRNQIAQQHIVKASDYQVDKGTHA